MRARAVLGMVAALAAGPAAAGLPQYCLTPKPPDAAATDRMLRVAAVLRQALGSDGGGVVLIARSGVDLRRFDMRYSHAGVALREGAGAPWAVRQLYFSCDERLPRLYDEGLAAFVLGSAEATIGFVSVLTLPAEAARPLEAAARDDATALSLLGGRYSANAHAFSTRYQNCNQWLVELLALAWQPPPGDQAPAGSGAGAADAAQGADAADAAGEPGARATAQRWLAREGYEPAVFETRWRPLLWLAALNPFLHQDDHPAADLAAGRLRVSMPHSIEAFVQARHPGAQRLELCHTRTQVVLRRDGPPLADDCTPEPGDTVLGLD